jgi:pimeloyl-ACP methyl ester carboxylesterase
MTGRYVAPSGSEIYFEETGAGRPILALHGVGGGAHFFRGVADRLRAPFRVVAIDLPGTGRSVPRGADPTATARALSLDAWMTDLGALVRDHLQEPVVIVGHSLGTILALEAWRRFSGSILALVFVEGGHVLLELLFDLLDARRAGDEGRVETRVDLVLAGTGVDAEDDRLRLGRCAPEATAADEGDDDEKKGCDTEENRLRPRDGHAFAFSSGSSSSASAGP